MFSRLNKSNKRRQNQRRSNVQTRARLFERLENRNLMAVVLGDFNGDGFQDMVVGAAGEDISSQKDAGSINVIYGNASGLTSQGNQLWSQNSTSVEDVAEKGDRFGAAMAVGDFNGDGFDDLAIGVPGEDIGEIQDAGAVNVLYGSSSGLRANYDQVWHQDSLGIEDQAEPFDEFGSALAAGDFNGDGIDDLAIGAPGETVNGQSGAGAVNVIYGSRYLRLNASGNQFLTQEISAVQGQPERYDNFGASLAAGRIGTDPFDDLAIGVPGEDLNLGGLFEQAIDAGAVHVLRGDVSGLRDLMFFTEESLSQSNGAASFDYFGSALAIGDFNGDGNGDLAIGAPGEDLISVQNGSFKVVRDAGAVFVMNSNGSGFPSSLSNQMWHQDVGLINDTAEDNDVYGSSLAVGDFNGDGLDDLAIGVPGEDVSGVVDAGAVNVLYGRDSNGLSDSFDQTWTSASIGADRKLQAGSLFGASLATGDIRHRGRADLAVAAPRKNAGAKINAGVVDVLYSSSTSRLVANTLQEWHQDASSIVDISEGDDRFGGEVPALLQKSAPQLASDPTATRHLFLDFDGTGTLAPKHLKEQGQTMTSFDIDGQPGFNPTEQQIIRDTWRHTSEDFAPFQINVSTYRDLSFDVDQWHTVYLGDDVGGWHSDEDDEREGSSGVSFGDQFRRTNGGEVFVTTDNILGNNPLWALDRVDVAAQFGTTASHEAGHSFGPDHKSDYAGPTDNNYVKDGEYSDGTAEWVPIMGNNLSTRRTVWSKAAVIDASRGKWIKGDDDLTLLKDAIGLRADDHGESISSATDLGTLASRGENAGRIVHGLIADSYDDDYFRVTVAELGFLNVQVNVEEVGANLNSYVQVGRVGSFGYQNAAPSDSLDSSLTYNVSPGEYWINVGAVTEGGGNLGRYTMRVEFSSARPAPIVNVNSANIAPLRTTTSPDPFFYTQIPSLSTDYSKTTYTHTVATAKFGASTSTESRKADAPLKQAPVASVPTKTTKSSQVAKELKTATEAHDAIFAALGNNKRVKSDLDFGHSDKTEQAIKTLFKSLGLA